MELTRLAVAPIHLSDVVTDELPAGVRRRTLARDPDRGVRVAVVDVLAGALVAPDQYVDWDYAECLVVAGDVLHEDHAFFGLVHWSAASGFPEVRAGAAGARLLVWAADPRSADAGHSAKADDLMLSPDSIPWQPVFFQDGSPTNYEAKTIRRDPAPGWTTWLMRLPAGWVGRGWKRAQPGGDELFVLSGEWAIDRDGPVVMTSGSYYCSPDRLIDGGLKDRSESGCVVLRWTRNTPHLLLPPERLA